MPGGRWRGIKRTKKEMEQRKRKDEKARRAYQVNDRCDWEGAESQGRESWCVPEMGRRRTP